MAQEFDAIYPTTRCRIVITNKESAKTIEPAFQIGRPTAPRPAKTSTDPIQASSADLVTAPKTVIPYCPPASISARSFMPGRARRGDRLSGTNS